MGRMGQGKMLILLKRIFFHEFFFYVRLHTHNVKIIHQALLTLITHF